MWQVIQERVVKKKIQDVNCVSACVWVYVEMTVTVVAGLIQE